MRMRLNLRRGAILGGLCLGLAAIAALGADALDRAYPPPLDALAERSVEVVDRDGRLLRAFATADGRWRLGVRLDEVDPAFVELLVAYEDRRFRNHPGVDPLAIARAAVQFVTNGRIVSGGSTITMQLARLIEPRESRSFGAKLRQMLRALQIERRLSKDEILERYLALAPYGGNLEGIRAASLAWFGKEPRRLELGEAALLVALPQLPELRRPDRNHAAAEAARGRVLERAVHSGLMGEREALRAAEAAVPSRRLALPALAAHAAQDAVRREPGLARHQLSYRAEVQAALEAVARSAAEKGGERISVAIVMADASTGEVVASVGSPGFIDDARAGWLDMTRAVRSPGSTLKPFIYGLAFEEGLVAQETMIEDRPANFAGYRPQNFDMAYQGDVSIRTALQMSLNVPAVRLLDAVGPARLAGRFRQAGVVPALPRGEAPGLAIALGGAGLTLRDLVQLYTGLANGGRAVALTDIPGLPAVTTDLLDRRASWQVADILAGVDPPEGAARRGIAYKTGTSYGYRDAWSVGFDGRHVVGVWVGRPDAAPVPGISGYRTAAPILFEAFRRSGVATFPLARAPAGALRMARDELPLTLRRFVPPRELPGPQQFVEPAPEIVFPPDGARLELASAPGRLAPLVLKLQGGRAPFRWLANGRPLEEFARRRTSQWQPDGRGHSTLTVIDSTGRAASVRVFVE